MTRFVYIAGMVRKALQTADRVMMGGKEETKCPS